MAHTEGSALSLSEHLYLFDIVASLCAGLNEHDIQFLSSLLALLRGDLSTRAESGEGAWPRGTRMDRAHRRPRGEEKERERRRETGKREKREREK